MNLIVFRNSVQTLSLAIGENTFLQRRVMGFDRVVARVIAASPLDLQIGDNIVLGGVNFFIFRLPEVEKINLQTFKYKITFDSEAFKLSEKKLLNNGEIFFNFHGTAQGHLDLIVANINTIDSGWSVGAVESTVGKTFFYSNQSCRSALDSLVRLFGLEYRIVGKVIYLQNSVDVSTTYSFQYGKGMGLYSLIRRINEQPIRTKVYGFGSKLNLDENYRGGLKRLVFGNLFVQNNTSIYGIKEGVYFDDTIFPQRVATVTAVDSVDLLQFTDSGIDFDLNSYFIDGNLARIKFLGGNLSGYEFIISSYDSANKVIHFQNFVTSNNVVLPNNNTYVQVGDTYTLIGISMPQSYIDTAEASLLAATNVFLGKNDHPHVVYELDIDPKFVRDNNINMDIHSLVTIIDSGLGINNLIRVVEIEYPLVKPEKVRALISADVYETQIGNILRGLSNVEGKVEIIEMRGQENLRVVETGVRSRRRSVQMVVFGFTELVSTVVGKYYYHVSSEFDGYRLVGVHTEVITSGPGLVSTNIYNIGKAVFMLDTGSSIDSGETGSDTAAFPVVINSFKNRVNTNEVLRIDVTLTGGTGALGLILSCEFEFLV